MNLRQALEHLNNFHSHPKFDDVIRHAETFINRIGVSHDLTQTGVVFMTRVEYDSMAQLSRLAMNLLDLDGEVREGN